MNHQELLNMLSALTNCNDKDMKLKFLHSEILRLT